MTTPTTPDAVQMPPLPKAEYVMGGKGYCGVDMYDYAQAYADQRTVPLEAELAAAEAAKERLIQTLKDCADSQYCAGVAMSRQEACLGWEVTAALKKAHELGFLRCAGWAQRDDLFADIGSATYKKDRDHDLSTIAAWNIRTSATSDAAGWQPIETAPKDGTHVLICKATDADGKPITDGFGLFVHRAAWWDGDDAWIVYNSDVLERPAFFEPTHWMPMLSPPATVGGSQNG